MMNADTYAAHLRHLTLSDLEQRQMESARNRLDALVQEIEDLTERTCATAAQKNQVSVLADALHVAASACLDEGLEAPDAPEREAA